MESAAPGTGFLGASKFADGSRNEEARILVVSFVSSSTSLLAYLRSFDLRCFSFRQPRGIVACKITRGSGVGLPYWAKITDNTVIMATIVGYSRRVGDVL